MRAQIRKQFGLGKLGFLCVALLSFPFPVESQWPFTAPTTPEAQRAAQREVQSSVRWLQNATRTSANLGSGGVGNVGQAFQALRQAYNGLKNTLNPQQVASGANDLAELDAGLDILEESFANYDQAVGRGQSISSALRNLCQVLRQGSDIWLQQFVRTSSELRLGWG